MLMRAEVMEGVPEMVAEDQVEATFRDGRNSSPCTSRSDDPRRAAPRAGHDRAQRGPRDDRARDPQHRRPADPGRLALPRRRRQLGASTRSRGGGRVPIRHPGRHLAALRAGRQPAPSRSSRSRARRPSPARGPASQDQHRPRPLRRALRPDRRRPGCGSPTPTSGAPPSGAGDDQPAGSEAGRGCEDGGRRAGAGGARRAGAVRRRVAGERRSGAGRAVGGVVASGPVPRRCRAPVGGARSAGA